MTDLNGISRAMIMAQAQALSIMAEEVTRGECADCGCSVCVSMRGIAAMHQ
jgi:hypothetical protein